MLYMSSLGRIDTTRPPSIQNFSQTTASSVVAIIDTSNVSSTDSSTSLYRVNKSTVYRNTALGFQVTLPETLWVVPNDTDNDPHLYNKFSCADEFTEEDCVGIEIQGDDEKFDSKAHALAVLATQQLNPIELPNTFSGAVVIKSYPEAPSSWMFAYHIFYPNSENRFLVLTNSDNLEKSVIRNFSLIADPKNLTDKMYKDAAGNSATRVLARGDVNSDGFDDAVVEEVSCGASCSLAIQLVINIKGQRAVLIKDSRYPDSFASAFNSSSALKTEIQTVSIKDGKIFITGKGIACGGLKPEDVCSERKWNLVKTAIYQFDGTNIVQYAIK